MTRTLPISQPFDLALSLEMGQAFRWQRIGDEEVRNRDWGDPPERWRKGGSGWYSGVLERYLVHARQTDDGIEYRVGDSEGERHDIDLDRRLHAYFRLDDDIEAIYGDLRQDPVVAEAIERYPGLRLLRQERWECLASYLCSKRNSIRSTKRNVEDIAKLSSRRVSLGSDQRFLFPRAQVLTSQRKDTLLSLNLGLDRVPNIVLMAQTIVRDPLMLDRMGDPLAPGPDIVRLLDGYPGIGPKIANCVALMSLDKLDAFPVDRWVLRALARYDISAMEPGLAEKVASLSDLTGFQQYRVADWARSRFGPYAGYAGQYLFHWVEPHKELASHKGSCPVCGPSGSPSPDPLP